MTSGATSPWEGSSNPSSRRVSGRRRWSWTSRTSSPASASRSWSGGSAGRSSSGSRCRRRFAEYAAHHLMENQGGEGHHRLAGPNGAELWGRGGGPCVIGFVAAGPAIHDGPFSLIRCTGGAVMAKKFAELRARMSAEARARSEQTAADTLAELQLPKDQSSTRRAGSAPASSPESSSSSPAASQD